MVTANALWGQQGYRFKPAFQQAIAACYGGAFNEVNFVDQPDEAVKTINAWVSDQTQQKIQDLIRPDLINSATRLILTNAIYFKGMWQEEFDRSDTWDDNWYGPGRVSKTPTMHQTGGFLYHERDDFQALDLPYRGGQVSMLIVLPTRKDELASLEKRWLANNLYPVVTDNLSNEEAVDVSLPRFKVEASFTLKAVLCALGAGLAFSDSADFGGIGEERLKISEVVHKAFVEVNEEGTEAAAATAIEMDLCLAELETPEPKVFQADHPFLFFIRDRNTNSVLFSGRVLEPE